jgi:hypothetical protein
MHFLAKSALLIITISAISFPLETNAAVDTEIIVFEIAKDANGSVLGWDQSTWSRAAWDAYGNTDVLERLTAKYKGVENYSVKIIAAGSHYIVYTTKKKNGQLSIGISATKDAEYFKSEQERINGYVEKYPGRHEIHVPNGFNERKELPFPYVETPGDIEQLPAILLGSTSKEGTFACGVDKGVGQYSIKEFKEGVFVIRGEGKGSMTKVDMRAWQKSGMNDSDLEKKWSDEVDRSMQEVCAGLKRDSSTVTALRGAMKTYLEKRWQERLKECAEGKRPEKDCEVVHSTPVATGVTG